jgi:large subunit ribosomal protein L10
MKKVGALINERIVNDIKAKSKASSACLFVSLAKTKAFTVNVMRNTLCSVNSKVLVAKNSLIKKALQDDVAQIDSLLSQETGVVFIQDADIVKACKLLLNFFKDNEAVMQIRGGILNGQIITAEQVDALSKLPGREELLARAVGAFAAPLTSFLGVINQVPTKFLWVLEEIKKTKEQK